MSSPPTSEDVERVRSVLGQEVSPFDIVRALSLAGNNPDLAINMILDTPGFLAAVGPVKQEAADRVTVAALSWRVKHDAYDAVAVAASLKPLKPRSACDDAVALPKTVKAVPSLDGTAPSGKAVSDTSRPGKAGKTEGPEMGSAKGPILVLDEDDECVVDLTKTHFSPYLYPRPISCVKPAKATDRSLQVVVDPTEVEDGDFPEERDWFLVGRTNVMGLSTCRGRNEAALNEIVHFSFPSSDVAYRFGGRLASTKTVIALSEIVRFSTKRCGEIGKLPIEWSRCLIRLVQSGKVKVRGRCVFAPENISLMQEIVLYVSLYIHSSVFTEGDQSSWNLVTHLDSASHPLPTLFKILKLRPFQKAEFSPEDLSSSRKRCLNIRCDAMNNPPQASGSTKRRKGADTNAQQDQDEQEILESALNKLVGAVDLYDLKEADPPRTLLCLLHPYQKQALYWMSELEKEMDVEKVEKTLHPCWEAYHISDRRIPAVYVNMFSGESTTQFASATQMARGGILAVQWDLGRLL